jgi:chemotaxis-related protein WspB
MLALCLRAHGIRYAIWARHIVEVLPAIRLRAVAHVPPAILGMLGYRGALIPVVELTQLLAGERTRVEDDFAYSTRIIVVALNDGPRPRLAGLLAEDVTDLVRTVQQTAGLKLESAKFLGDHLVDVDELPQLINMAEVFPEVLKKLFEAQHELGAA